MTDLLHVLPDFPLKTYTHLIPSLEKHLITTSDLLTLDAVEIGRRAQLPILDLKRLINEVISLLHGQLRSDQQNRNDENNGSAPDTSQAKSTAETPKVPLYTHGPDLLKSWATISTLDPTLDACLGGGIPTGYITEITGESGVGKTQLLLLLLLSCQLPPPHGLSRPSLYISTESPLPTPRLRQLLSTHPHLSALPAATKPSLSRILSISTPDLESQSHILTYQLPVAVSNHSIGLVIIDSIAANWRAESDALSTSTDAGKARAKSLAARSADLVRTGSLLRNLARQHNCAVVVANQVSDRIERDPLPASRPQAWNPTPSPHSQASAPASSQLHPPSSLPTNPPSSPSPNPNPNLNLNLTSNSMLGITTLPHHYRPFTPGPPSPTLTDPRLSLDHQMRFFTGWGDGGGSVGLKTPALGLTWTNQIACRVALVKEVGWGDAAGPGPGPGGEYGLSEEQHREGDGEGGMGGMGVGSTSAEWTPRRWRRWFRVVFCAWAAGDRQGGRGVEFEVWGGGVRALGSGSERR